MKIAVPREIKPFEGRVALVPEACADLVRRGHSVYVQAGAGQTSGFGDGDYVAHGAEILPQAPDIYATGELIVKVKEPYADEPALLREGQVLFCYLHLAANPALLQRLLASGVTAVGFETVKEQGRLPVLAPMSIVAGRLAVQMGATLLYAPRGGKGMLLGGLPAAERGRVVVLGAGNAGGNAVRMAAAMGAGVTVFDRNPAKLDTMSRIGPNVTALYPYAEAMERAVTAADLLIGAVLVPGARAPRLVTAETVGRMEPGSVIVDIAVDQGGCVETSRPTSYDHPTYQARGVTHFCVANMPGAVPRSASTALCASLMPYLLRLANPDWRQDPALSGAVNLDRGELVYPALRTHS